MKLIMTAAMLAALVACAKEEATEPAGEDSPAPIASEELGEASAPRTVASAPEEAATETADACPVVASRAWKAWTAPDGTGTTLHVAGEIDLPTPGYTVTWDLGPTDRMAPPGQRVILKATPPEGLVAQVVTPTPVAYATPGAYPEYRTVIVTCAGETLAEIEGVGAGE